ncbi:SMP-30/gluconolactonase/LRE family protein [Thermodesulfobacteriota bacterium]
MTSKFLILCTFISIFLSGPVSADECKDSDNLKFICGPINAEDILPLGDTEWLITSGLNGQFSNTDDTGHIYLVNREEKTFEEFFPGESPKFNHNKEIFNACPGPINYENFSAHGLALTQTSSDRFNLYITGHGEREAIEVFEIDIKGIKPFISWTGCVPLPDKMLANSVAILSDGGFVTTKFFDPTPPNSFNDIFQGKITGGVYEWHPGGSVNAIPGTDISGANGIAVSPDDKWVYASATGTREIIRYNRTENPVKLKKVQISIMPDNIRWGDDGLLYTVGDNPPDEGGWSVFSIHPETMTTKRVTGVDQTATMQKASAAILLDSEIWIGTYSGDRIGYLPKP